ncbi:MAG: VOC family protein [Oscillatoriales cyanobacterium SM2_1_8]|nr:VOC family protein [Oscillatoriales cyanobacterium SM2_1_8]
MLDPPQPQPWGAIAFWFTDPDGHRWEIFQPPAGAHGSP